MKRFVMAGMIGMVMMAGSFVRGADPAVTVKIKPFWGTESFFSGTHSKLPDETWSVFGFITGLGSPDYKAITTTKTTFSGQTGENHSTEANDTVITIQYRKKGEPTIEGEAHITVISFSITNFKATRVHGSGDVELVDLTIQGNALPIVEGHSIGCLIVPEVEENGGTFRPARLNLVIDLNNDGSFKYNAATKPGADFSFTGSANDPSPENKKVSLLAVYCSIIEEDSAKITQ